MQLNKLSKQTGRDVRFYFKVTPSYFEEDSESLLFYSARTLNEFLNYSKYECAVEVLTLGDTK